MASDGFHHINWVFGTDGDDQLEGPVGFSVVRAGKGDDKIFDHPPGFDNRNWDDLVFGGSGDDWMQSFAGNDFLSGGAGKDTFKIKNFDDTVIDGGAGDDSVTLMMADQYVIRDKAGATLFITGDTKVSITDVEHVYNAHHHLIWEV